MVLDVGDEPSPYEFGAPIGAGNGAVYHTKDTKLKRGEARKAYQGAQGAQNRGYD